MLFDAFLCYGGVGGGFEGGVVEVEHVALLLALL